MKRRAFGLTLVVLMLLAALPAQASVDSTLQDMLDHLLYAPTVAPSQETLPAEQPISTEAPSLAEEGEATLQKLQAAIARYLDSQYLSYSYDETHQCFTYALELESRLGRCDVNIFVFSDGFEVFAFSPLRPKRGDDGQLAAAAEFLTRANYGLYLGNFEMDYSDGEIRYKTAVKCFDQIPVQAEIEWLVDVPSIMIDKYGDGLINVLLTDADPAKEIDKIEQAY